MGCLRGLQESGDLSELFRGEHLTKCWHVHAAVYDTDHDIALRKFVPYVSEIWTATPAVAVDQVATEATFLIPV
jgi:hypothetical protein